MSSVVCKVLDLRLKTVGAVALRLVTDMRPQAAIRLARLTFGGDHTGSDNDS
jgi:hypothetical protein